MVLKLSLVLDRPSYRPGNLLGAIVEVANVPIGDAQAECSVALAGLEVMCEGTEWVDGSWVSPSFHADYPTVSAARKTERHIFHAKVTRTPNSILHPATKQRFYVSIRLPENLPPSFRGQAVRFAYQMRVKATEVAPRQPTLGSPNNASPFMSAGNGRADVGSIPDGVELPPHTVKVGFSV
eukprot:CAMPEP_0177782960 /NCGR_PEP_ID=MMETSP0491_2-20121128/18810_1 /TAXON_ID=63592 /ORGANISM="Tetraselmis chuii, Strain PLY429" /LENGTH=180 /DNA_ID=CAMNT_0019303423 /DNA_START=226 /DNA_END=765 /DNA_ORIENTATION=+